MTALRRILKHPHGAVFDTTPGAQLAFRLRHAQGSWWSVSDEVLTVTVGDVTHVYHLDTLKVSDLVTRLRADGFEVTDVQPGFAGFSASVLVEGRNNQGNSNGDNLNGFTSLMWSLFGGYARELRAAKAQIPEALRQMVITQAEGEWLDLWGQLYDQPRAQGQLDPDYSESIPREAFRVRLNALAIEKAILEITGKDVRIEQPWREIFRLDESQLSGDQKFYDGGNIGYHLIRPVSTQSIEWDDVLAVIRRNIAAGVIILDPETRVSRGVDARLDGTCAFGITSTTGDQIAFWTDNRLDYMVLSDEELVVNYGVTLSNVNSFSNAEGLLNPKSISTRHTIAMASMELSGGPPLGDINAIFPRAELVASGRSMTLSDDAVLSSFDHKPVYRPVDRITDATIARLVAIASPENQGSVLLVHRFGYGSMNQIDGSAMAGASPLFGTTTLANTPVSVSMIAFGNVTDPVTGADLVEVSGESNTYGGAYDIEILEVGP